MKTLSLIILLVTNIAFANKANIYQLTDLEMLVNSSSYEEFFLHINDIKPSERTSVWKDLVLKAIKNYSNQLIENELVNKEAFNLLKKLSLNKNISKNDIFIYKYYQVGIEYFKNCLNSKCNNELNNFWRHSDKNHDLASNLFEIYKSRPGIDTWLFVEKMVQNSVNKVYCAKPGVQKILFENLIKKHIDLSKPYSQIINAYVNPVCFDKFRPFLKGVLSGRHDSRNEAFLMLESQEELTTFEKDLFYTTYILNKPTAGVLFDKAWTNTVALSHSFKRRNKVISQLDQISLLPDGLLRSNDLKKINSVYSLVNNNFPELIDYYASSCIHYYKGTKIFKNGNPTMNCKMFFKMFKNKKWLSDNFKQKFNSLKLL